MPLIRLTGPPRFVGLNGTVVQLVHHPIKDTRISVLVDESRWTRNAQRGWKIIDNKKVSRPRFEMELAFTDLSEAANLISILKSKSVVFYPRTRADSDDPDELEVGFNCRVVEDLSFTKKISSGVQRSTLVLESLGVITNNPSTLVSTLSTALSSGISSYISGFIGLIDLATYPVASDFWDNVTQNGENIRVRSGLFSEIPFEIGPDFSLENRTGTVYFRTDLSDVADTDVRVEAVDMLFPEAPATTDINGRHNVYQETKWHWSMGEKAGSDTLIDSGPNEANLVPVNVDDSNHDYGVIGFGQDLNDGVTNEHFTVSLDFPVKYFMIEAWVNVRGSESDSIAMGIASIDNDIANPGALFELARSETDQWRFTLSNDSDSVQSVLSTATVDDNQWVHLVGVYFSEDDLTHSMRLYVDGQVAASDTVFVAPRSAPSGDMVIGARYSSGSIADGFRGKISEVTLYDGLPSSFNSLDQWVAARYNQLKPDSDLWSFNPDSVKTVDQGYDYQPRSVLFPEPIPYAVRRPAYGIVGDELIVAGGYDGSYLTTVSRYLFRENRWLSSTALPAAVARAASGVISGTLFVAGGFNGSTGLTTLYARDPDTGSWQTLTALSSSRYDCGFCVYENELWVIGGIVGGVESATVEIYNPISGLWRSGPSLSVSYAYPTAIVANGTIFVVGGQNGGGRQDDVFELVSGAWVARSDYPTNISRTAGFEWDGEPTIIAGLETSSGRVSEWNKYSILGDSWNEVEDLGLDTMDHITQKIGGHVLIAGGFDGSSSDKVQVYSLEDSQEVINDRERREPIELPAIWHISGGATDFLPAALPGDARRNSVIGEVGGRIILVGGETASGTPSDPDRNDIYDPHQNGFLQGAPFPSSGGVTQAAFGVYNSELWVFGGRIPASTIYTNVYKYNPATDVWSLMSVTPSADAGPSGCWYSGKFYRFRGSSVGLDIYDPSLSAWTTGQNAPVSLQGAGCALLNGKIYFTGSDPASNTVLQYDPVADSWATMNNFPVSHIGSRLFVSEGTLYCYRGVTGDLYEYDEGLDSWSVHSAGSPDDPVSDPALICIGSRVHLFGGDNGSNHISSHQLYSFERAWL